MCFASVDICAPQACLMLIEARWRHQILCNWSYRRLWTLMGVLETDLGQLEGQSVLLTTESSLQPFVTSNHPLTAFLPRLYSREKGLWVARSVLSLTYETWDVFSILKFFPQTFLRTGFWEAHSIRKGHSLTRATGSGRPCPSPQFPLPF